MEYIQDILNKALANPQHVRYAFLGFVALATGILTAIVIMLVYDRNNPVQRRVGMISGPEYDTRGQPKRYSSLVDSATSYVLPKEGKELVTTRQRLIHAGFRDKDAPTIYYLIKAFFGILFPLLVFTAARLHPVYTTTTVMLAAGVACLLGFLLPSYILDKFQQRRQKLLSRAFPDALDMLVVCVEAGLGLNAAIQRVAREINLSHSVLADELKLVNEEIRAGVDRSEALHNLASRTGLADIKGLVSLLSQSTRLGTSVADALRIYSEEFRDKRMQQAEERAAMIGTKLIFPLVLCIFPAFFVVAVGPAALAMMEVFRNLGN